jgi:hypothetical protein
MSAAVLVHARPRPMPWASNAGMSEEPSAYFGITIDAAVNLLEAREYAALDRDTRLRKALGEQTELLTSLLGFAGRAAFDLRIITDGATTPKLRFAILGRLWGEPSHTIAESAVSVAGHLRALMPRHVTSSLIEDPAELAHWLDPFPSAVIDSAVITKSELLGYPSRPDAQTNYYFSVVPFNQVETDWGRLYSALAATSGASLVVSVGIFPVETPPEVRTLLTHLATYYGRLSQEDTQSGGLYYGTRKIPPDAFAVEATQVFHNYLRRCSQRAYISRIQISGPSLPAGIAEAVGSVISPSDASAGSHLERQRVAASYEIRRLSPEHASVARWNLAAIDCYAAPGQASIWNRPDNPGPMLARLSTLGDANETGCAFRLPIAVDGVVPGFAVRRGQFGHSEAYSVEGPAITLGTLNETGAPLRLPVAALTKHALVAGSPGSGKTTTVLETLRQLWVDHGVPFLVIEPVNSDADDYRRFANEPGFEALRVVTVGDENGAPLRFNPFQVPANVLVAEHIANLLACFKAAFGLFEPLPSIYQDALNTTYADARILSAEVATRQPRRWPTAVEFTRAMRKVTANLGYAGDVKANIEAASIRRAQQLTTGASGSTFLTDQSLDMASLLDVPVVLELKSLGSGDEQSLMIALLLNAMTEYYQAERKASPTLVHVTVIEEAHRLLGAPKGLGSAEQAQAKEKAAEAFANTLAENRKYGEGVLVVEQIPTKLVADAVKNTNLKLMHRLTAEEDRRYLGESMGLDDAQKKFATRLQTGEALAYSDQYAETAHISITRTMTGSLQQLAAVPTPPFNACAPCRAKCAYRGAALAMARQPELRAHITTARRELGDRSIGAAAVRARWVSLADKLRDQVRAFPAFANSEPEVSDAAYCVFLHAMGYETMTYSSSWADRAAHYLGIPPIAPQDDDV